MKGDKTRTGINDKNKCRIMNDRVRFEIETPYLMNLPYKKALRIPLKHADCCSCDTCFKNYKPKKGVKIYE